MSHGEIMGRTVPLKGNRKYEYSQVKDEQREALVKAVKTNFIQ